jgi:hypothetical protein
MVKSLKYGVFENIVLSPRQNRLPIYDGGLATPQNFPRYCRHNRNGKPVNTKIAINSSLREVTTNPESPFIFGGVYQWHFGHTIAEFIHRLWILEHEDFANGTVLFIAPKGQTYAVDFFRQAMDYMQVKQWQIIDEPCIIDRMVIAEQGKTLGTVSRPQYTAFLNRLADVNALHDHTDFQKYDKLAILRGHLKGRRYACEYHLAAYLETQGYHIFYSDNHPLETQLKTIMHAKDIIISDGSACHLFDMLPVTNAKICFLSRSQKTKLATHSLQPKARSVHCFTDVINVVIPLNDKGKQQKSKALLFADLDKIIAFLKQHNFLDHGAPAITAPPYIADIEDFIKNLDKDFILARNIGDDHPEFETIRQAYTNTANIMRARTKGKIKGKAGITRNQNLFNTWFNIRSYFRKFTKRRRR